MKTKLALALAAGLAVGAQAQAQSIQPGFNITEQKVDTRIENGAQLSRLNLYGFTDISSNPKETGITSAYGMQRLRVTNGSTWIPELAVRQEWGTGMQDQLHAGASKGIQVGPVFLLPQVYPLTTEDAGIRTTVLAELAAGPATITGLVDTDDTFTYHEATLDVKLGQHMSGYARMRHLEGNEPSLTLGATFRR